MCGSPFIVIHRVPPPAKDVEAACRLLVAIGPTIDRPAFSADSAETALSAMRRVRTDSWDLSSSLASSASSSSASPSTQRRQFSSDIEEYFATLHLLTTHPAMPARIRYMAMDVIDMRRNGWRAREIQVLSKPKPQKLNQVRGVRYQMRVNGFSAYVALTDYMG